MPPAPRDHKESQEINRKKSRSIARIVGLLVVDCRLLLFDCSGCLGRCCVAVGCWVAGFVVRCFFCCLLFAVGCRLLVAGCSLVGQLGCL